MNLSVDIGLLWDEPAIRGELICDHRVICRVDCCREIDLGVKAGAFSARFQGGERAAAWGVRLAEAFSKEHAEAILAPLYAAHKDLALDIVEAGRTWQSADGTLENRVWWPVVTAASRAAAEATLIELAHIPEINPVGLFLVRLDRATANAPFEFTLGDFSASILEVITEPAQDVSVFWLYDVPIGRGFHWERKEQLEYRGGLRLFSPGGGLTATNRLPLETYLESAVGSEMRSDLPPAFSQAQAIAARSTVLATAGRHHYADGFDVCNDDHCQCYQGVQREATAVVQPVRETAGQILLSVPPVHGGARGGGNPRVVDARYAKSCGGASERYEAAWGEEGPEYFAIRPCGDYPLPDLSREEEARAFLLNPPPAYCNGELHPYPDPWDKDPLFRWTFRRTRAEWGALIEEKTGVRVGDVAALHVSRRGASGRILALDVLGSEGMLRVNGELHIRRALSPSHLPSSYFVVDEDAETITLTGGGWGHGVGLCQLGAAAMAKDGWSVERILAHYYPHSALLPL